MKKRILLLALVLCTVFCFVVACNIEQEPRNYTVTYVCDTTGALTNETFTYVSGVQTLSVPVTLAEGYTQSTLSVTYVVGDGEPVTAELADGAFSIANPNGNVTVTVSGAKLNEYKVSFLLGNDVKHTVTVAHGSKLTDAQLNAAKEAVTDDGYKFVKWTESVDGAITANTSIHAETELDTAVVTFVNGTNNHKVAVEIGKTLSADQIAAAKQALTAEGYHFVSFDVADLETKVINSDLTVNVTTEINVYTVTIKLSGEDDVKATFSVNHGATLTEAQIAEAEQAVAEVGYHVTWDKPIETTAIVVETSFTATKEINTYAVKFVLGDAELVSYTINHGATLSGEQISAAQALAIENVDAEHKFTGWDVDLSATITAELTVKAQTRELYKFDVTFASDVEGALDMDADEFTDYTEEEEVTFNLVFAAAYTQSADSVTVTYTMGDSESQPLTRNNDNSYTIASIIGNVTVTVSGIELNKYNVTASADGIAVQGFGVEVEHGQSVPEGTLDIIKSAANSDTLEVWGWKYNNEAIVDHTVIELVYATAITSAEQYLAITQDGNYFLAADIDMGNNVAPIWGNVAWTADPETCGDAANGAYRGTLDGRNHTITFDRVDGSPVALGDYGLMFYRLVGTVKNVNVNVTLGGAYYANVFSAVAMQLAGGTIENVNVSLNTVGASLGYPGTQLTALVGNFYGGTVKDCSVTLNTAVYKLVDEHVAPIGTIKSWVVNDVENNKVVETLSVRLPANVKDVAALGNLANVPHLAKDESVGDAFSVNGYAVDFTADNDNDFLWNTATEVAALADSTLYEQGDITAPRGFEKVYKSNGMYDDSKQGVAFLATTSLEPYNQVAFALRTDNRRLCDSSWVKNLDPNTWYVFIATKNVDGTWTVNAHKETSKGDIAMSIENVAASKVGELYKYYNYDGDPTSIWSTELRVVNDPEYVPMTSLGVSALASSTLQADEVAPEEFTSVYKSDKKYGTSFYEPIFANLELEAYSSFCFALKTDQHNLIDKVNQWSWGTTNNWVTLKGVKNADGEWNITISNNGSITTLTRTSTTLAGLYGYLDETWGNNGDNTIWSTEVWATADPNYVSWSKIADTALADPTDPNSYGLDYPYDFTVMTRTNTEVEVPNNWQSYNGGAAFLADTDISAYTQVRFAIMTPTAGYRDYPWNGAVSNWAWGLFTAQKQDNGTWTLTVSVNGNTAFTITGIENVTKLSDLYRMQSVAKDENSESISTTQLIYSTEVYAK